VSIIDESTLPERIRSYDWAAVFEFCGPIEGDSSHCCGNEEINVSAALGSTASPAPFQRVDVADVIACSDGEHEDRSWVLVARLKDGRFAFVSASCDYTGWDCRSGGYAIVSHDLDHLKQFGIGADEMVRLFPGGES
jgi:hypothetical protein